VCTNSDPKLLEEKKEVVENEKERREKSLTENGRASEREMRSEAR
jgi:hypothetical protein